MEGAGRAWVAGGGGFLAANPEVKIGVSSELSKLIAMEMKSRSRLQYI